jgi:nucleotide-binding universal stress UspA family protein
VLRWFTHREVRMSGRTIIIGVDFGEPSLIAARWVARELGADADLVLTHAVHLPEAPSFLRELYAPPEHVVDDARADAETRLRTFADSLGAPHVRAEVQVGRPEEVLSRAVDASSAQLLVVGPRRQDRDIRRLLGNIAERALRRSRASVLLARGLPDGAPTNVLVGLDETPLVPKIIAAAATLVAGATSRVTAMYVASSMTYESAPTAASTAEHRTREDRVRARAEEWIVRRLAGTPLEGARARVAFGEPGVELVEAARALDDCLLVVGRNGGDENNHHLFGRATEVVLAEGEGPVLVVSEDS